MKFDSEMTGSILRRLMVETGGRMLKPARLMANLERADLTDISGVEEHVITAVEAGNAQLMPSQYLALAASFDRLAETAPTVGQSIVDLMTPEYVQTGLLPSCLAENAGRVLSGLTLTQRWFISFEDGVNQLAKEGGPLEAEDLELLALNYKIFTDETALADESFPNVMAALEPILRNAEAALIVPASVREFLLAELDVSGWNAASGIRNALSTIDLYCGTGRMRVMGNEGEGSPADVIEDVFTDFRDVHRFLLITQDAERAQDAKALSCGDRKAPVLAAYLNGMDGLNLYWSKDEDDSEDALDDFENSDAQEDWGAL